MAVPVQVEFERVMERLPLGAQVVVLFGEIDCREGILAAVARDIYQVGSLGFTLGVTGVYLGCTWGLRGLTLTAKDCFVCQLPGRLPRGHPGCGGTRQGPRHTLWSGLEGLYFVLGVQMRSRGCDWGLEGRSFALVQWGALPA